MQNEREKDLIIEARFHRQLIGPKGENIQKIRDDFAAVQISFPDLGSKSDIVKLVSHLHFPPMLLKMQLDVNFGLENFNDSLLDSI